MIQLVEYQTSSHVLSEDDATELGKLTKGGTAAKDRPRVIERLTPREGAFEIQPGPYVGRFRLRSGRLVNITSRFAFDDLAALLGLGQRTTMLYERVAQAGHRSTGLVDLIALAFVREVERIAGQGLVKGYERRTFTRPPYAGVPSAAIHLSAHAGRPDRLATTASRLTQDLAVNRIIAAAHRRLCGLSYADKKVGMRLQALGPVFHRLTALAGPPPRVDGLPRRYREVHQLARLVLAGRTVLPTGNGAAGVSVLFNMTQIWEEHLGRWLRSRYPGRTIRAQHLIPLTDSGHNLRGYADFVVEGVGVFDAKYRLWKPLPSTSEVYQMFTYAQRLGVTRAVLVHPGSEEQSTTITMSGVTIENLAIKP